MSTVEIIASEVRELEPMQQKQVLRFLQALRKQKEQNEGKVLGDVFLLRSRDWRGKKMGAKVALSREVIASAVRADRDAR